MSSGLAAGIYYHYTEIEEYLIETPAEYKNVHVYDKFTGVRSKKKEKVLVKEEKGVFKFKNIEEENAFEFCQSLAELFDCEFAVNENNDVMFHPKGTDYSGEFLSLDDLSKKLKKIYELKKRIEKTGFSPSRYEFISIQSMDP